MPLHQMPNMPGAGVMTDTLDFVKNLWGSMGVPGISIPGIASPTLSVDDLDKKISELKAVESWLALNSTMLRSSIQALEVQRGTIAALKSMGESLAAMSKPPVHASAELPKPAPAPEPKPEPQPAADKAAAKPHAAADAATAAAAQMANPALWWNMLQEQFKQAVTTAMTAEPPKASPAAAAGANGETGPKAEAEPDADADADPASDADKTSGARKPAAKRAARPPKPN